MRVINSEFEIVDGIPYHQMLDIIEGAYRICYASEPEGDSEEFIRNKMRLKHFSPLEHCSITVDFIYDRGVSHEKVRHRLAAFSQQSTRYCNYNSGRFGKEITVIKPSFFDSNAIPTHTFNFPQPEYNCNYDCEKCNDENCFKWNLNASESNINLGVNKFDMWFLACRYAEWFYINLIEMGATPQEARSVLPNSLATKIRVTANIREWRHILELRALGTTGKPHPQMKEVMLPLLNKFVKLYPAFFEDLDPKLHLTR